jgi:CheY-like chemotaxis protein/two-component sensor histidine kinase
VINNILDMSKIEANKFELSFAPFSFEKMLHTVSSIINFLVAEKGLNFDVSIDKDIPAALIGDDQRLAQVITNLLSNAVKFTPKHGDIRLEARLEEERGDLCTIRVSVTDTGIGISADVLPRLFTSFEQAESGTSRKFGGTGLGLSISRRIIEMMDGRIWVESEPGKGSTFVFTIRIRKIEDEDAALLKADCLPSGNLFASEQESPDETKQFEGCRALLAEDIDINREIVLALLESTRLTIDCVENGAEALRVYSSSPEKYDMVLMDVQMPEMDGYEATRRIRALGTPHAGAVPIVAMTANAFREDVEKCLQVGMNDHLSKPLDFNQVLLVLRKYLSPRNRAARNT